MKVRHTRRLLATSVALLTAAFSLTGCGDDDAVADQGNTVKFGIVTSVGTRVDFADVVAGAQAAAAGVNARGGIGGKDVEIVFCNESLDPNKGRACVRDLIKQDITAMTGMSVSTMEADAVKMLNEAGIANLGSFTYGAATSDPNSYLLNGGHDFVQAASIKAGVDQAGPQQVWVPFDVPLNQAYNTLYAAGLPVAGGELVDTVRAPPTTTDMAPIASQVAKSGADVMNPQMAGSLLINLAKTLHQLGWDGRWVTSDTGFVDADLDLFPDGWLDRGIFVGFFPPMSAAADYPGLMQLKEDFTLAKQDGVKNVPATDRFVRGVAVNAYFAVIAAAQVADQAGVTDSESFKKAMDAAENIDLGGVMAPWNPNASASKSSPRVSNGAMYVYHWENGTSVLDTPEPVDVTEIWESGRG